MELNLIEPEMTSLRKLLLILVDYEQVISLDDCVEVMDVKKKKQLIDSHH